ncbi:hypothetical protein E4U41_006727 [Claviceps citrina]|nr:hypothetical protein E4U41_006727 [Claviceps citrina]
MPYRWTDPRPAWFLCRFCLRKPTFRAHRTGLRALLRARRDDVASLAILDSRSTGCFFAFPVATAARWHRLQGSERHAGGGVEGAGPWAMRIQLQPTLNTQSGEEVKSLA